MAVDDQTRAWFSDRYWADDDLLRDARERFAQTGPLIEVPNETGALLATLVAATGARRVLEVGTLFGYSAVWMARAMRDGGVLDTLELDDAHADAAEELFRAAGLSELIRVHRGPAAASLAALEHGSYDLVFLDADKEGYAGYLEQALDLVRPGATIVADNVAQAGRLMDPTNSERGVVAMRAFHDILANHPRLSTNVLPIGDGVSVSVVVA